MTAPATIVCYEVFKNGTRLCRAGVPDGVFGATMMWGSHPPGAPEPWSCNLRIGGLTGDTHVDWVIQPIGLGDEVVIKVLESQNVDPAKDLRPQEPAAARKTNLRLSQKLYAHLREQMDELEAEWGDKVRSMPDTDA